MSQSLSKPRLLYLVNHPRWFLTHRLPLAKAAAARGFDVHVATPSPAEGEDISEHGLVWHALGFSRSSFNPFTELRAVNEIRSLMERIRPAVLHNVTAKPVMYGTWAARVVGVPAVVNSVTGVGHVFIAKDLRHRLLSRAFGAAMKYSLRHENMRAIFQNADDLDLYVSKRWVRPEEALLLAGGAGVDLSLFTPPSGGPRESQVVILPARLLFSKGVVEFVDAARMLKQKGVTARFVLVGEPDSENPASIPLSKVREWVSSGVVESWGFRRDMSAVYREADIVVLPSYREGTPKALLEAAACGRPVITTDVPGCRESVEPGRTGLLVPARDFNALAVAMEDLLADRARQESFGRRARILAEQNFGVERVNGRILRLYEELSARRN